MKGVEKISDLKKKKRSVFCLHVEEGQGQVGVSPVCYHALSNQCHALPRASSN